nr:SAM-dependent methyltransferase [Nocardiopsis sp. MG754419]
MTDVRGPEAGPLTAVFRQREPLRPPGPPPRVVGLDGRTHTPGEAVPAEHVRLHQAFLGRIIDYLCADAGVRQFVDWGCPVPGTADRVRSVDPDATVVHIAPQGAAGVLVAPDHAPVLPGDGVGSESLLRRLDTGGLVDLDEPVAVLMTRTFCADSPPTGLDALHRLMRGGGYLALTSTAPRVEVERAFAPFRPLEPGVADLAWWPYPDEDVAAEGSGVLAGLGRAPGRGGGTTRWR